MKPRTLSGSRILHGGMEVTDSERVAASADVLTNATSNLAIPSTEKNHGGRPSLYQKKLLELASGTISIPDESADIAVAAVSSISRPKRKTLTSYRCGVCGKELSTKEGLLNHGSIHIGEKPFICQIGECKKGFRTKSDRSKHHKTHMGVKMHTCEECLASFTTKTNLKTHQNVVHSRKKNLECKTCQKTFGYLTNYRNHLLIHTGEKPFICSFTGCGQKFTEYSTALRHALRRHASDGTFRCPSCEKCYRSHSSLRCHQQASHKDLNPESSRIEKELETSTGQPSQDTLSNVVQAEVSYFTDLIQAENPFIFSLSADEEREAAVLMGLYDGECEDEIAELRKQSSGAKTNTVSKLSGRSDLPWELNSNFDDSTVDLFPELTATVNECRFDHVDDCSITKVKPKRTSRP